MSMKNTVIRVFTATAVACWLTLGVAGCRPAATSSTDPNPAAPSAGHDDHGDHGHSHGHHEAGPHGGHLVELGDEQLHAEWTHQDGSGEVVVYLLDSAAESDVAISAATISITTKIGETEKTYELAALAREDGQSSRFAVTDPSLVEALKAVGPGIEATIAVEYNEGVLVGTFERHEHAGHQH